MRFGDFIWLALFAAISYLLINPEIRETVMRAAVAERYSTGFVAFSLTGALGEALIVRFSQKKYPSFLTSGLAAIRWGLYGLVAALGFWLINGGVVMTQATGILPGGGYNFSASRIQVFFGSFFFTEPFFTSVFVNLCLLFPFMFIHYMGRAAAHIIVDERRFPKLSLIVAKVDWAGFFKTEILYMPLFRIPMMTIIFMLPQELWLPLGAWTSIILIGVGAFGRPKTT